MIEVRLRVPLYGIDPLLAVYGIQIRSKLVPARATIQVVELGKEYASILYRDQRFTIPRETLRRYSYTPRVRPARALPSRPCPGK